MQEPAHLDTKICPKCGSVAVSTGATPMPDGEQAEVRASLAEDLAYEHFGFQWSCVSCDYTESTLN
ncbi:MAG: hypothetical protein AB7I50_14595 [Vicinamibacterales bacterium]